MKKVFCFSILSLLLISSKLIENKIRITYLGYKSSVYRPNFSTLEFEISNNSRDTIYLSKQNIIVKVIKEKSILREKKTSTVGTPFVKPIIRNTILCKEEKERQERMNRLKFKFASKLYEKNFGSNTVYKDSKDFIIENIVRDCIILMPNESIDYDIGFYSEKFDKTCKVDVKYLYIKRFTYFVDDKGKKIDINN